jgi:hypothetical protein
MVALTAPAQAADFVRVPHNVTAAAEVYITTCPWDTASLSIGDICVDTDVSIFQVRDAGTTGPPQPWSISVVEFTGVFVGGDEQFVLLSERYGVAPAEDGYVDAQHMLTAAARGTVPMSEGGPVAVDLRWDVSDADVQVSGNHGPTEGFSWGRHGLDGCMVQNLLAHQRWRADFQGISGTLGGTETADLYLPTDFPAVFIEGRSTFKIIINQTGVDCLSA